MTAKDLKNALLQEAVQGKLVPQIASEGNAKDLVASIACSTSFASKTRGKQLPPIIEDEIPFDIPESWCWCRLGEIVEFGKCENAEPNEINDEDWILDLEDIEKDTGKILSFKIKKDVDSKSTKHIFKKNYVLYSKLRPYLNKCVIAPKDGFCTSEILPLDFGQFIYNRYAQLYLMSPFFVDYTNSLSYGVKMPRLGTEDGKNALFPLPPLAEQKRIVAAIEQFMPLIEEYGKKEAELTSLNADIVKTLKNAILQEAVQGKLTPQIVTEGNAKDLLEEIKKEKAKLIKEGKLKKEKPLPEITEEEIPFDIPENWCWTTINEIAFVTKLAGFEYTSTIAPNLISKGIPLFKGKNIQNSEVVYDFEAYISEAVSDGLPRSQITRKCLLTPYVGTIGNIGIHNKPGKFHLGSNVGKIETYFPEKTLDEYIFYYLKSTYGYQELTKFKKATAQESISIDAIRQVLIPLPSITEQKRIVVAIEQLLPLCEKLGE